MKHIWINKYTEGGNTYYAAYDKQWKCPSSIRYTRDDVPQYMAMWCVMGFVVGMLAGLLTFLMVMV